MAQVKLLNKDAKIPTKGSKKSAGWDLYSCVDTYIKPNSHDVVPTGISIGILEQNSYGRIAPRSGLAVNHGINVGAGVVDADYTGEIKVVLFNHSDKIFHIQKGDRIAQLIFEKLSNVHELFLVPNLVDTDRGAGGFGSTGR